MTTEASGLNLDDNSTDSSDASEKTYLAVFETTAVVQCVVRVKSQNKQEAFADATRIAETSDLAIYKIKSIHQDSLVNISIDQDTDPVSDVKKGNMMASWIDQNGHELSFVTDLSFEEAKTLAQKIQTEDTLTKAVEIHVKEISTGRRVLSVKSPRGGFEITATKPDKSSTEVHSWIENEESAVTKAYQLKGSGYSSISISNLVDRENPKVVINLN